MSSSNAKTATEWRKSSWSVGDGNCVEVTTVNSAVLIRDSKNPSGCALAVTVTEWHSWTRTIKFRFSCNFIIS